MNLKLYPIKGSRTAGLVILTGSVVTTTSGTIGSTDTEGFTLTKVAAKAGRYLVTLTQPGLKFRGVHVSVMGAADAAYTTAKGLWMGLRRNLSLANGTFEIQFQRTDTGADAEVEDGATFEVEIKYADSSLA